MITSSVFLERTFEGSLMIETVDSWSFQMGKKTVIDLTVRWNIQLNLKVQLMVQSKY